MNNYCSCSFFYSSSIITFALNNCHPSTFTVLLYNLLPSWTGWSRHGLNACVKPSLTIEINSAHKSRWKVNEPYFPLRTSVVVLTVVTKLCNEIDRKSLLEILRTPFFLNASLQWPQPNCSCFFFFFGKCDGFCFCSLLPHLFQDFRRPRRPDI